MDFRDLLANYFTEDIVNLILEKNKLQIVKDVKQRLKKLDEEDIQGKKCENCPFVNQNKKRDFPAWLGDLDEKKFSQNPRKDVMIIGISPNDLDFSVHIAYGLAYDYSSEKDLDNLKPGARKFWENFYKLFNDDKEYLHNNIYITDMAFCDCKSNDKKTLEFCSKERIMKEIEFINPKLLIIHGLLIKKLINTFPKPTVCIPHIQGRGIQHYPPDHPIWCEAKAFIQNILNH